MKPAIVAAILLAACQPTAPREVKLIDAPPMYERAFKEIEACSGLHADYSRLHFFSVPHPFMVGGRHRGGEFVGPDRIYIDEAYVDSDWIVKHEEMHYLIKETFYINGDHPAHYFNGVCGDLIHGGSE